MEENDVKKQINDLYDIVAQLKRASIQIDIDPTTALYLKPIVAAQVATAVATLPTQTYSGSLPGGVAPTGSVWFYDTGSLATREIHVYSGSAWVRFK